MEPSILVPCFLVIIEYKNKCIAVFIIPAVIGIKSSSIFLQAPSSMFVNSEECNAKFPGPSNEGTTSCSNTKRRETVAGGQQHKHGSNAVPQQRES